MSAFSPQKGGEAASQIPCPVHARQYHTECCDKWHDDSEAREDPHGIQNVPGCFSFAIGVALGMLRIKSGGPPSQQESPYNPHIRAGGRPLCSEGP